MSLGPAGREAAYTLARAVLEAARLYEESYDQAKADAMGQAYKAGGPMPDYNACYTRTLEHACNEACGERAGQGSVSHARTLVERGARLGAGRVDSVDGPREGGV